MATKHGHHYGGKPVAPAAYSILRGMQDLSLEDKIEHALSGVAPAKPDTPQLLKSG